MAYIQEAIAAEKSGLEVVFKKTPEPIPHELQQQFKATPALKTAFFALTPGRQRAYLLYFSAAKQSKTRASRIEKCRRQILRGKGLTTRGGRASASLDRQLQPELKTRRPMGKGRPIQASKHGCSDGTYPLAGSQVPNSQPKARISRSIPPRISISATSISGKSNQLTSPLGKRAGTSSATS